jgi:type II secretory ATPase GspE/PulE/Tfp pilus assembly ATPase PilB-like protein
MRTLLLALALLAVTSAARATEVRLANGQTFHGAKILSRTISNLELQVEFGTIVVSLSDVQTIDGKRVRPPVALSQGQDGAGSAAVPQRYEHNFRMDFLLLGLALVIAAWLASVIWVQQDARGSAAEVKHANVYALLLPGLGVVFYLVARARREMEKAEPRTLSARVAGLQPNEAPKKRGLFGRRGLLAAVFRSSRQSVRLEFLDANHNPIQINKEMPEMTGIEAAREILQGAIGERASDIHLEPHENGCRVRFRVDGVLQERTDFERTEGLRVAAALKAVAQIDVAEKRKAQDGRFRVRTQDNEVDFRVATASSIHGEKLVLRILDRRTGLLALEDLGMSRPMMERFDSIIHSRNGIILATGPTGSGKTSTLYAGLGRLESKKLNIMSIEDPVEYELAGATQIPVNPKAGVTYEAGLRSILRQDPDVIFVGEMRDVEAARIAIRAALTGHLVFSSLHTQDAPGAIVRLTEMGVERYQISSALLMILTQRLVRLLCRKCREPYATAGDELVDVGLELPAGRRIYRAVGCEECDQTGYRGRTGIFELLVMDETLRKAVTDGAAQQELTALAQRTGYRPYRLDGVDKILAGRTSVEEVLQAS